jgi:hypothetical protein
MRQYVIDQLRPEEYRALKAYLDAHADDSGVDGLYWIPIEDELLSPVQRDHLDCRPFAFALELTPDQLAAELLVRTRSRMRCACIAYATDEQRAWLISMVDTILEKLGVSA